MSNLGKGNSGEVLASHAADLKGPAVGEGEGKQVIPSALGEEEDALRGHGPSA